jgi:predicted MPP superfamily phosphohydrolase
MRRIRFGFLIILVIFTGLISCVKDTTNPPGDFHALILSDTHISSDRVKDGRLQEMMFRLNRGDYPGVEFLIVDGDCVSRVYKDYTSQNPDTSENRVHKLMNILMGLNIPFYLVMGNHDYKIGPDKDSDAYFSEKEILKMETVWKRWTGFDPYYSFDVNGWRFVVLNSMRGRPEWRHFDDAQLDWLESVLQDSMPTVLLSHFPLKTDHLRIWCKSKDLITPEKESRFYSILREHKQNIKGIFVGHGHMWVHDTLFKTIQIYEVESFGDSEKLPFYLAGFEEDRLHVSRVVESMGDKK